MTEAENSAALGKRLTMVKKLILGMLVMMIIINIKLLDYMSKELE